MIRAIVFAAVLQSSFGATTPQTPGGAATLCLDPLGFNLGATCHSFNASRIDTRPDICQCLNSGATVTAPYCRRGEHPQAESADYDRARWTASRVEGTLIGKSYKGRSYCVTTP